ncbi:DNA replication/repair protein RecF [Weissella koreensis]|uniref:DNA replication and repair protein RecF n=1 Tax=Weissella koreensis TaxID=165096 RepID=A0A7H1MLY9_9LACO|nr:DNA replication/repair protein RecF [Weissella koreensis]AVH75273.1 DNA replication and repair protein RecF [Weissella koreensis]EJF33306.1 recombination protein F [Weissella koreensis KCTC 3621]QGN20497.1 DNA replication/repair protein RecF [Weissella koreensis]QNT64475.1 DNA replication/repair protein RecF [Weissella koreensis]
MRLSSLELDNFRNYQNLEVEFSPGVNVFLGSNAQGKTNLLEAIYVLALARSHRAHSDKELIGWSQKTAKIKGVVERRTGKIPLSLAFSPKGKKARMNHLDQAKLANYIGQMNVILFAPEDLNLVKGSPQIRRQFIDREFSQMSPKYLYIANQYRGILKQRNQYLKQLSHHESSDELFLEVLTEQLIEYGSDLIWRRLQLLKRLDNAASPIQEAITKDQEHLKIEYVSQLNVTDLTDLTMIQKGLKQHFNKLKKREIQMGTTLLGPHRDDLQFMVNGHDVATFGSQGQQRTTALAVKLAEIDLMKEETGEEPILLLDDVLSELDSTRQTHLLTAMQDRVQTFITTPSLSDITQKLIKTPRVFKVEHGTLTLQSEIDEAPNL